MTDDQQLRDLFNRMCLAWTNGDARAYGACFTADCDYVSYDGYWERGRDPMVRSHDKLLRGCCPARPWSERWSRSGTSVTTSRWCTPPARCWSPGGPACRSAAAPATRSWPFGPPTGGASPPSTTAGSAPSGSPSPTRCPPRWPGALSERPGRSASAGPDPTTRMCRRRETVSARAEHPHLGRVEAEPQVPIRVGWGSRPARRP